MKRAAFSFLCAASSLVSATDWHCDGEFGVSIEALYWRPCSCEREYLFSPELETSRASSINPKPEWGFRLGIDYLSADTCRLAALDWTLLRSTTTQEAGGGGLIATAKQRVRYDRVNLRGGYYLHHSSCIDLYAFAGVRYLYVDLRQSEGRPNLWLSENSRFQGGGLELGLGGEYRMSCGLNLVGQAGPTASIGRRTNHAPVLHLPSRTICAPGLDFRIGINYTKQCRCLAFTGEVGYELNYFYGLLALPRDGAIVDRPVTGELTSCRNIGFAGPYARVRIGF
jgi:hypothetical protein